MRSIQRSLRKSRSKVKSRTTRLPVSARRARNNPDLQWRTLGEMEKGNSVLFVPVSATMVKWAAAAYQIVADADKADRAVRQFLMRRHEYLTGEPLAEDILNDLTDADVALLIREAEGPDWADMSERFPSLSLGNLGALPREIEEGMNRFEEERKESRQAAAQEAKRRGLPEEMLYEIPDSTAMTELMEQATLLAQVKTTLGFRAEEIAVVGPEYGVLGSTLLSFNIKGIDPQRGTEKLLNLRDIHKAVLELNEKMVRVLSSSREAEELETVKYVGKLPATDTSVYWVITGPETDIKGFQLNPMSQATPLHRSSMRGMAMAIFENNLFEPARDKEGQSTFRIRANAAVYFGFPKWNQNAETGVDSLVNYLTSYRQTFALQNVQTNPKRARKNTSFQDYTRWLPKDPNEALEIGSGTLQVWSVLENTAARPFRFVAPNIVGDKARSVAQSMLTSAASSSRLKATVGLKDVEDLKYRLIHLYNQADSVDAKSLTPELIRGLDQLRKEVEPFSVNFGSVEHAYQALKTGRFDREVYNRVSSFVQSREGVDELDANQANQVQAELLLNLMRASFIQNPFFLNLLKLTSTHPLHVYAKNKAEAAEGGRANLQAQFLTRIRMELLDPYKVLPEASSLDYTFEELGNIDAIQPHGQVELVLREPWRSGVDGLKGYLQWLDVDTAGKHVRRKLTLASRWDSDKGVFQISSTQVNGTIGRIDDEHLKANLLISGIGTISGVLVDKKDGLREAPSPEFVDDLLAVLRRHDLNLAYKATPEYQVEANINERLLPYFDRLETLSRTWRELTQSIDPNRLALLRQIEKTDVASLPFDDLTNLPPGPSESALGFWMVQGGFPLLGLSDTVVVVPDLDLRVGSGELLTPATKELKRKLAYCPYVLAQTVRGNIHLFHGDLDGDSVRWVRMPAEDMYNLLWKTRQRAEKAKLMLTDASTRFLASRHDVEKFRGALLATPMVLLFEGSRVGWLSVHQYYGSDPVERQMAYLRTQKRAQFAQSRGTVILNDDVDLLRRLGDIDGDSEYDSVSGKLRGAIAQSLGRDQIARQGPWSFLRLKTEGRWDYRNGEFVPLLPEYNRNLQIIEILDEKLSDPWLIGDGSRRTNREQELTQIMRTVPVLEAKAAAHLPGSQIKVAAEVRDANKIAPIGDTPLLPFSDIKGNIKFILMAPDMKMQGYHPHHIAQNNPVYKAQKKGTSRQVKSPWRGAAPFNGVPELRFPWLLQTKGFRWRWSPLGEVMENIFPPEQLYEKYGELVLSGGQIRQAIKEAYTKIPYEIDNKNVYLTHSEEERILEGKQRLLVRPATLATSMNYSLYISPNKYAYVLRPRGLANVYDVLSQESDISRSDIQAQRIFSAAFGATPSTLMEFMDSPVARESNNFLVKWIQNREPAAVYDIMPAGTADQIDWSKVNAAESEGGFKDVPGIARWQFSEGRALRRYLAEKFNLIPPEKTLRGTEPSESEVLDTVWGYFRSKLAQATTEATMLGTQLTSEERKEFDLRGPLILVWYTETAMGQLRIPTEGDSNIPSPKLLRSVYTLNLTAEDKGLRTVRTPREVLGLIDSSSILTVVNKSGSYRKTLWRSAEQLLALLDPKTPLYEYVQNYLLTAEDKKNKELLETIDARVNKIRATKSFERRLARVALASERVTVRNNTEQQLKTLVIDFIAFASYVENHCYWSAISAAVNNNPRVTYSQGKEFLQRIWNWNKEDSEQVELSDIQKVRQTQNLGEGISVPFLRMLTDLNFIRLHTGDTDPLANADMDVYDDIVNGNLIEMSGREAFLRNVVLGSDLTALIEGQFYRGRAARKGDLSGYVQLQFAPVAASEIPYNPVLSLLAKQGKTIFDPKNMDEISTYLIKLRAEVPKKYVHTGQMLQFDYFIKRLKDAGMTDKKALEYLEQLARANPRRARQNPLSHGNPLEQEPAELVGRFTSELSRDRSPDPADLARVQSALEKVDKKKARTIDRNKLYTYFPVDWRNAEGEKILDPTTPSSPGDWATRKRVTTGVKDEDLLTRVFRGKRSDVVDPYDASKSLPVLKEELEMTAEDAAHILEEQRKKQVSRRRATIPPSAGLCKSTRSKRLMDYSPPDAIKKFTKKGILIWLSPDKIGGEAPKVIRVLQYRKGNHVDCDLSARALEEDLTSLLGRALQASLFWLTEKPRRDRNVNIWVGRVGTRTIYKAYAHPTSDSLGDYPKSKPLELSMDQLVSNLEKGLANDPNYKVTFSNDPKDDNFVDTAGDLKKWGEATADIKEKVRTSYKGEQTYYTKDGRAIKASTLEALPEAELERLWAQYEDPAKIEEYKKRQKDVEARRAYYLRKLREVLSTEPTAKSNPVRHNPGRHGRYNPFRRGDY